MTTDGIRVPLWSEYNEKTGLCGGKPRRVPSGLVAERIGGTRARPLVRVWWAGAFWYGWIWS